MYTEVAAFIFNFFLSPSPKFYRINLKGPFYCHLCNSALLASILLVVLVLLSPGQHKKGGKHDSSPVFYFFPFFNLEHSSLSPAFSSPPGTLLDDYVFGIRGRKGRASASQDLTFGPAPESICPRPEWGVLT